MHHFTATLDIIGVNPFVFLPDEILSDIFRQAGKEKGTIPVKGEVNGLLYRQTLVKFSGAWRLYINMVMLKNSPKRIGETLDISITFDPERREIDMPTALQAALDEHPDAQTAFLGLAPSRQKEIVRYIAHLKCEEAVQRNVARAIRFLCGEERFVGRDKP